MAMQIKPDEGLKRLPAVGARSLLISHPDRVRLEENKRTTRKISSLLIFLLHGHKRRKSGHGHSFRDEVGSSMTLKNQETLKKLLSAIKHLKTMEFLGKI